LYFLKSNKSYNIASYINEMMMGSQVAEEEEPYDELPDKTPEEETDLYETDVNVQEEEAGADTASDGKWYEQIDCIDTEAALKNSGSEEAFKTVLKIFYDSIGPKSKELEECYSSEDWENYTIKIHALKSSARLVGALGLGEDAQLLETAGKENDIGYIRDHHTSVMTDYLKLGEDLAPLYQDEKEDDTDKPPADDAMITDMYEGLRMAAEAMDCDMLEDILNEIDGYRVPDREKEKFSQVRQMANAFDYDGILKILG
jgi:HPt (histidine-containing phosphotransfer) domain-containing protein